MKLRISAIEAAKWAAYERLNGPLGPTRMDWLAAQVEAAIWNSQRVKGDPIEVGECVLFGERPKRPPQSLEQMKALLRMAAPPGKTKAAKRKKR